MGILDTKRDISLHTGDVFDFYTILFWIKRGCTVIWELCQNLKLWQLISNCCNLGLKKSIQQKRSSQFGDIPN